MMRALIDSNIFIAKFFSRDQYYEDAKSILQKVFVEKNIERLYLTDYVVVEIVDFLLKKGGFRVVNKFLDTLVNTKDIKIIYMGETMFYRLRNKLNKYKSLSFTDCSLLIAAEDFDINVIYSFDKGFDKVKGIKRKVS